MFTFTVTPDGAEPYTLTAGTRDVLAWEKVSRGKTINALMQDLAMTDLYRIAHLAATRQQLFTGPLAEFESTCELELDGDADGEAVDPTRPAASPGG